MGKKCPTHDGAVLVLLSASSLLCVSLRMIGDESTDLRIPRKIIPRLKSLLNNRYQHFFLMALTF